MAVIRGAEQSLPQQGDASRVGARVGPRTRLNSPTFLLVVALWILMVFEIDLFLSAMVGGPFYRIPLLLAPIVVAATLAHWDKRAAYWPLILFTLHHLVASVVAQNAGLSRSPLKFMIYVLILFASSVVFVNSPPKANVILKLYLLSFVWFGLQGLQTGGRVVWHSLLANEDSYGPLMVMLMPISFFFALATSSATWRWIARVAFAIAVVGVIVSFARGAALTAAVVFLYILLRTPNKPKSFMFIMVAAIILMPMAGSLVKFDAFTAEVASSTEGDPARMAIWKMAWLVFKSSPIFGVGAANYGVVGAQVATPDIQLQMGAGLYMLATHNAYLQILAEEGLIGIAIWITMLVSIFRWNRYLRTRQAEAIWLQKGGEHLKLRLISLGLDGSMLAFLGTAVFYNQLYIHWIWSLLIISYVLYCLTRPGKAAIQPGSRPSGPRTIASRRAGLR
jgi:O-antigen ligase